MLRRYQVVFYILLLLLTGCGGSAPETDDRLFYRVDDTVYLDNRPIFDYTDGYLRGITSEGSVLVTSRTLHQKTTNPNEIMQKYPTFITFDVFDTATGELHSFQSDLALIAYYMQIHEGYLYCLSNQDDRICRFSLADGTPELLPVCHYFTSREFLIDNGRIVSLHLVDNEGTTLQMYDMQSGSVSELFLSPFGLSQKYFLGGSNLYCVSYGEKPYSVSCAPIPDSLGPDTVLDWQTLPLPSEVLETGFNLSCIHFWGDYVLYETPERALEVLDLRTMQTHLLWYLPEHQDSSVFEPMYFYSDEGLVVSYYETISTRKGEHTYRAKWPPR